MYIYTDTIKCIYIVSHQEFESPPSGPLFAKKVELSIQYQSLNCILYHYHRIILLYSSISLKYLAPAF